MSKLAKPWTWRLGWRLVLGDKTSFSRSQIYRVYAQTLHDRKYVTIEYVEPGDISPTKTYLFSTDNAIEDAQQINELLQKHPV